jgi:hypothetical protein
MMRGRYFFPLTFLANGITHNSFEWKENDKVSQKKIIVLFILCLVISTYYFASLRVYPMVAKIQSERGKEVYYAFDLQNSSNSPLKVNVKISDFFIDQNGNYFIGKSKGIYSHSCANWIKASNSLILSPKQEIKFPIVVTIPNSAAGYYYAAVTFSYYVSTGKKEMFKISMNLPSIVAINVKNSFHTYNVKIKSLKIYNPKMDTLPKGFPSDLKNYPYVLRLNYVDVGNVVVGLQGQMRIVSDSLRRLIGVINLNREDTICFPEITRTVWIPFERLMPNGEYRALLSADLGNHHMVSQVFKFKITDASISQTPALKLDTSEINIPLERLNTYLSKNFKVESLDYRKIDIVSEITGFSQTKDGTIISAPLDKEIFGNLKMYPFKFSVYPYSEREARIAGRAPSSMPSVGQHYALLKLVASVDKGKEPKILEIPIVMSVGKLTKSLSLNNLKITPVGTSTKVSIDVVNYGNSYVDYSGQIFVTNEEGKSMLFQPVKIKGGRVYAGFTVSPSAMVPVELKKGYTLRVVVKYSIGKGANGSPIYQTVSKELTIH